LYVLMLDYPLVYWSAKLRPDIWWRFEEFETWGLGDPPEMPDGVMGLVPEPAMVATLALLGILLRRARRRGEVV
jgi:hypothetical protein